MFMFSFFCALMYIGLSFCLLVLSVLFGIYVSDYLLIRLKIMGNVGLYIFSVSFVFLILFAIVIAFLINLYDEIRIIVLENTY